MKLGAGIHEGIQQFHAGQSVGQTVVHAGDDPRTIVLQSPDQSEVPERALPVEHWSQDLSGNGFELGIRPVFERYLANVVAYVEVRIEFPTGQAEVERRGHHSLTIARNDLQLRLDKLGAS